MIRSMLFVPADRWRMIEKAAASAADAVCIDLEDAVAPAEKAAARANVIRAFRELDFGRRLRMFRINGLDTSFAYRDAIEVVEAAGDRIDTVMLPKANAARDVHFLDTLLSQMGCGAGIEAQIETAAGFLNAREIAQASPRLRSLIFGPGDFAASMRMPQVNIGEPGPYDTVMQTIVAAARVNNLRCLDGPYAGYKDAAGFERACRIARALGFDGKQCIHPSQLDTVNAIFAPTAEEIAQARRILEACEHGAAASLDGKMIDAASIRMARVILQKENS
jgi:citrate lyase beta subunit